MPTAALDTTTPSPTANARARPNDNLGRLKLLGIKDFWQLALLLPDSWDDYRHPLCDYTELPVIDTEVLLLGRLAGKPKVKFDGTPRLIGYLVDPNNVRVGFTFFGDTREIEKSLEETMAAEQPVAVAGVLFNLGGQAWLKNPELVDTKWVGKLRPKYHGIPRAIKSDTVRTRVLAMLTQAIPRAAAWLEKEAGPVKSLALPTLVGKDLPFTTMASCLWAAHLPETREKGLLAQELLENIAALKAIEQAQCNRPTGSARFRTPANTDAREQQLPFALTADQREAVRAIRTDLSGATPMRRVLSGDVGSGKTVVYALGALGCTDGGGRACLLLPNSQLAQQVTRTLSGWWPDLQTRMALVTNEVATGNPETADIVIGTTALLHRAVGEFSMVVVDEQQKFSREQREKLVADGTHLLEVTATCIPRSQALVQYGIVNVSRLITCHVAKEIRTRIWVFEERAALFDGIRDTLRDNGQVLVVYPKRETREEDSADNTDPLPSAEDAFAQWNKRFPGRVRLAHGGQNDAENSESLQALRDNNADIMICTSIVETGIDLPRVRRMVVMHPERLGLTQLHQLRGRVARTGGVGYCDLYCPRNISEDTQKRLDVLVATHDGFRIAQEDLLLRGFGNLGTDSDKQSGADDTFLFGRPLRPAIIEAILQHRAGKAGSN